MSRILVLFLILIFFCKSSSCQLKFSVGYLYDGHTLTMSTNPEKRIWGEFRINTNEYKQTAFNNSDRGIIQGYCIFRLLSDKIAAIYAGTGLGFSFLSEAQNWIGFSVPDDNNWISINFPVGITISPFRTIPDLHLIGDYTPMIIADTDHNLINTTSLGFRYAFGIGSKNKNPED